MISIDELKEELRKRDIEVLPDAQMPFILTTKEQATLTMRLHPSTTVAKIVNRLIELNCVSFAFYVLLPEHIRFVIVKDQIKYRRRKYRSIIEPFSVSFFD